MGLQRHKIPFVLASTKHGPMILSTLDWQNVGNGMVEMGPGSDILINGGYDVDMVDITTAMLQDRLQTHGAGVTALDCGANIGTYTVEWARLMDGWGQVIAWEPQERVFYVLAGNVALSNLFNVKVINGAVGRRCGVMKMPVPDYGVAGNYGGVTLRGENKIGQPITEHTEVAVINIDAMQTNRVDFIKLDVEGMEVDALEGARETIKTHGPYILVEWHIAGADPIKHFLDSVSYDHVRCGMNMLCAPAGNAALARIAAFVKGRGVT